MMKRIARENRREEKECGNVVAAEVGIDPLGLTDRRAMNRSLAVRRKDINKQSLAFVKESRGSCGQLNRFDVISCFAVLCWDRRYCKE